MVASPTKAMPFALGSCKKDRKMRNESAPLTTAKRLRARKNKISAGGTLILLKPCSIKVIVLIKFLASLILLNMFMHFI
jgi:hypothetical protein